MAVEALRAAAIKAQGFTQDYMDRGVVLEIAVDGVQVRGWQTRWAGGPHTCWLEKLISWQRLGEPGAAGLLLEAQDELLARLTRGGGIER